MNGPEPPRAVATLRGRIALIIGGVALSAIAAWSAFPLKNSPPAIRTETTPSSPFRLPAAPGQILPFVCEPAFGDLLFWDPLYVAPLGDDRESLLIVERRGTIQAVRGDEYRGFSRTEFLDITPSVVLTAHRAEEGLLGFALHPAFAHADSDHQGEVFAYYVGRNAAGPTNRLSRFRTHAGRLDHVDPASEEILIDQPDEHQAHNAGSLAFGPDGYLYLALGDDASQTRDFHAQRITHDLFSGILRLDVDCRGGKLSHPPPRQPRTGKTAGYMIPSDNPFVGHPQALEEFYAIGFRNPWRMSFDRKTGLLYAADPGDRSREEINLVRAGSNCGWGDWEGTLARPPTIAFTTNPVQPRLGIPTPPLFEYSRDYAHRCVIGGYVYRGSRFPELQGHYIYADQSRRIYALELLNNGTRAGANRLIAVVPNPGIGISSLGEDADGELYICTIGSLASETGCVYRLRRTAESDRDAMPETLAETGLFENGESLTPHASLTPFEVNVPFWSDGADKQRWVAPPPGAQVTINDEGRCVFPPGTVFAKHFTLATDRRNPDQQQPLETRILVCAADGEVFGASYRWSEDGRQTRLVNFNEQQDLQIVDVDGRSIQQTWIYPGRFECEQCHNASSGRILGFNLRQLDRNLACPEGGQIHQFAALASRGVLSTADAELAQSVPRRPLAALQDSQAPLEDRVRSYLDVNCSVCHNPGRHFAAFDARFVRPLTETGIVNGATHHHSNLGPDVRVISPGNLKLSMMHLRLTAADPVLRMPPLGSTVVDHQAALVFSEWIQSLPASPVKPGPVTVQLPPRDNYRR